MEYVEAEGNSIDEAIDRALQLMGVTRDKVDIDIISNATRGLFGLGGRRAKVRATMRTPLRVDAGAAPAPTISRPSTPSPPAVETPRRAAPPANRASTPPTPQRPSSPPVSQRPSPPPAASRPPAAALAPPPEPIDSATLSHACTVLQDVVRLMGTEAHVQSVQDAEGARLLIEGDASGVLIGRRGQTLDALEYVINRIVAREDEHSGRVAVDSHNYRERRRQSLEDLAHRLAERARRRGKTVTLNPMSPRDRRIVHLALQNERSLVTRSAGKGYFRKLLIIPEGGDRGEPDGRRRQRRPPRES